MAVQDAPHTTVATSRKPPAYRRRKGYTQAIVTLTEALTKRRRDSWVGGYGSATRRITSGCHHSSMNEPAVARRSASIHARTSRWSQKLRN